jgi:hypothetical protein
MDPMALGMMIFTIVVIVLIGGFILLLPLTRRLGQFLEYRMSDKRRVEESEDRDRLLRAIEALRDDVVRLAERQDFTEKLLAPPDPPDDRQA